MKWIKYESKDKDLQHVETYDYMMINHMLVANVRSQISLYLEDLYLLGIGPLMVHQKKEEYLSWNWFYQHTAQTTCHFMVHASHFIDTRGLAKLLFQTNAAKADNLLHPQIQTSQKHGIISTKWISGLEVLYSHSKSFDLFSIQFPIRNPPSWLPMARTNHRNFRQFSFPSHPQHRPNFQNQLTCRFSSLAPKHSTCHSPRWVRTGGWATKVANGWVSYQSWINLRREKDRHIESYWYCWWKKSS